MTDYDIASSKLDPAMIGEIAQCFPDAFRPEGEPTGSPDLMSLWLVKRPFGLTAPSYDVTFGHVYCSKTEEQARAFIPRGDWWPAPEDLVVLYLGRAAPSVPEGEVLNSFNAG